MQSVQFNIATLIAANNTFKYIKLHNKVSNNIIKQQYD